MSVRDNGQVINCLNVSTHDTLVLDKENDIESNLVLASLSIRDFKMLSFIKSCLKNNHSCSIYNGYKA